MSEKKEEFEGWEYPIHQSLTEKILLMGVPRSVFYLNITVLAFCVISLHTLWLLPLNIAIHIFFVFMSKDDPYFFDCFKRYINRRSYYGT